MVVLSLTGLVQVDDSARTVGDFAAVQLEAHSPTLDVALAGHDSQGQHVTIAFTRADTAYARHAAGSAAADLGRALRGIASGAQGDMQALLAALDWSAADGREVREALTRLGAEAYDSSARAALAQQSEFNWLILRCLLAAENARLALAAGAGFTGTGAETEAGARRRNEDPAADKWQFWATPFGSGAW